MLGFLKKANFQAVTPYNRKSTFELPLRKLETQSVLDRFLQILTSDHFFLLLSNWTGLKLHPEFIQDSDDEESDEEKEPPLGGAYRSVVRKWQHKNYTLLHDADTNERASLDLFIHFLQRTSTG